MTVTKQFNSEKVVTSKAGTSVTDIYHVTDKLPALATQDTDIPNIDDRHPDFPRSKVTQISGERLTDTDSIVTVQYTTEEFTGTGVSEPDFKFRVALGTIAITEKFARRFVDKCQRGTVTSATNDPITALGTMIDKSGIFKEAVPGMVIAKVVAGDVLSDRGIVTNVDLKANKIEFGVLTGQVLPVFVPGETYELNAVAAIGPQKEGAPVLRPTVEIIGSKRTNEILQPLILAELTGKVHDGVKEFFGTKVPGIIQFISASSDQIGEDFEGKDAIWQNEWVFRADVDGFQHRWFEVNAGGEPISDEIISIIYQEADLNETGVASA